MAGTVKVTRLREEMRATDQDGNPLRRGDLVWVTRYHNDELMYTMKGLVEPVADSRQYYRVLFVMPYRQASGPWIRRTNRLYYQDDNTFISSDSRYELTVIPTVA